MQASSAAFPSAIINTTTGVLIVGAGPTGLALACDLRSRGIDVTIVDKAIGPATTSRALALKPRGTEILDRLGALGDLPRRAVNMTGLNIYVGERQLMHVGVPTMMAGVANPGALIIGQTEIEAQLRARLAELQRQVAWGVALVDVMQTGSGVAATLRDGDGETIVHADWIVGCDGAHSQTRKLAGIAFDGAAFAEEFLLADVPMDWKRSQREAAGWLHADGMFGAIPLPGPNNWRLMAELPAEVGGTSGHAGSPLPEAEAIVVLDRLLRQRVGDLTTRIGYPSWVSLFRFHRRLASSYRRGRILLAGDAAHIHSPFGGEGMNTGLGDAYNLGWKLAMVMRGLASESLIDTYEVERRPVASDVLKRTTNNTNVILGKSVTARLVRDCLLLPMLKLLLKTPPLRRKMMAKGSQLSVNYRGGPLARDTKFMARLAGAFRSSPKAGDRGPNAPCYTHPAGEPTTLGRETCAGWALLLFGGHDEDLAACAETARSRLGKTVRVIRIARQSETADSEQAGHVDATLVDRVGEIATLYRARGSDIALVRPDGHLAWRATSPNAAGLAHWLGRVFDDKKAPSVPAWRSCTTVGAGRGQL